MLLDDDAVAVGFELADGGLRVTRTGGGGQRGGCQPPPVPVGAASAGAASPSTAADSPAAAAVVILSFFMVLLSSLLGQKPWSESRGFDVAVSFARSFERSDRLNPQLKPIIPLAEIERRGGRIPPINQTEDLPVIGGRSASVTIPGSAATTADTALVTGIAV